MSFMALALLLFFAGCSAADDADTVKQAVAPQSKPDETAQADNPQMTQLPQGARRVNPFLTMEEEKNYGEKAREILNNVKLSAIFNSPKGSYAVIDGAVVSEDDTLLGKKVIAIGKNSVILKDAAREYVVNIQGGR